MANGIILQSGTVTAIECLHYALNLPTVGRHHRHRQHGDAGAGARGGAHLPPAERGGGGRRCCAKTADAASRGEFEPFKTSSIFDATAQHPEWLGEEPERLQKLMPA